MSRFSDNFQRGLYAFMAGRNGKGTLRVTCPKCHAQTTVKS